MNKVSAHIIRFIDFFYTPFKRIMPEKTFRYAVCGAANTVLGLAMYYVCFYYFLQQQNFDIIFFILHFLWRRLYFYEIHCVRWFECKRQNTIVQVFFCICNKPVHQLFNAKAIGRITTLARNVFTNNYHTYCNRNKLFSANSLYF